MSADATYDAEIHPAAADELERVPEPSRDRFHDRFDEMRHTPDVLSVKGVMILSGPFDGLLRVRAGSWRAIVALEKPTLRVLLVDRRHRVYDRLDAAERRRSE